MNAESWLAKEKDLIEKATYNEDYVWQPPETRWLEKKAAALTLAEYSALWIRRAVIEGALRSGRGERREKVRERKSVQPEVNSRSAGSKNASAGLP